MSNEGLTFRKIESFWSPELCIRHCLVIINPNKSYEKKMTVLQSSERKMTRYISPQSSLFFCFVLIFSIMKSAFAMDIFVTKDKAEREEIVVMKGPIKKGDTKKLIEVVKDRLSFGTLVLDNLVLDRMPDTFMLSSQGGDLIEALRMAEVLRGLQATVKVRATDGDCISACFFLYLGGIFREAQGTKNQFKTGKGYLGLHRPYFSNTPEKANWAEIELQQRRVMRQVAAYLADHMVPQRLTDEMMSRASTDIYWATEEDLRLIGKTLPEVEERFLLECGRANEKPGLDYLFCGDKPSRDSKAVSIFKRKLLSGWVPENPLEKYK